MNKEYSKELRKREIGEEKKQEEDENTTAV